MSGTDRSSHKLRLLALVMAGFLVPAFVSIGLQTIPETGRALDLTGGPYHAGVLFQLMLVVVAGLALIGEVPRWALALPVAVWISGAGLWWHEKGQLLERLRANAKPIAAESSQRPVVVSAPTAFMANGVVHALMANYDIDRVYGLQNRPVRGPNGELPLNPAPPKHLLFSIARGAACDLTPANRSRAPYAPPQLKALGQCVVREGGTPPAGGLAVDVGGKVTDAFDAKPGVTPIEFSLRGGPDAARTRIDMERVRGPIALLLPVAGCWPGEADGSRTCGLSLARSPFLVSADTAAVSPPITLGALIGGGGASNSETAYYIAGALGLKRRAAP